MGKQKQHLEVNEYVIQMLVGSGFLGCEFQQLFSYIAAKCKLEVLD